MILDPTEQKIKKLSSDTMISELRRCTILPTLFFNSVAAYPVIKLIWNGVKEGSCLIEGGEEGLEIRCSSTCYFTLDNLQEMPKFKISKAENCYVYIGKHNKVDVSPLFTEGCLKKLSESKHIMI